MRKRLALVLSLVLVAGCYPQAGVGVHFGYVEVGTSDFETLLQSSPDSATGLSVDAVPVYLSRLPNRTNHHKWNAGLAYRPGMDRVFWLHPDDITAYNLPDWLRGCSAVGRPHPLAKETLSGRNLMHLLRYDFIPIVTFTQLVDRYNVTSITTVKIDAELHSLEVAQSVAECCLFRSSCCPAELAFEFFDKGPAANIHNYDLKMEMLKHALHKLGYKSVGCQTSTGMCTYKADNTSMAVRR